MRSCRKALKYGHFFDDGLCGATERFFLGFAIAEKLNLPRRYSSKEVGLFYYPDFKPQVYLKKGEKELKLGEVQGFLMKNINQRVGMVIGSEKFDGVLFWQNQNKKMTDPWYIKRVWERDFLRLKNYYLTDVLDIWYAPTDEQWKRVNNEWKWMRRMNTTQVLHKVVQEVYGAEFSKIFNQRPRSLFGK